MKRFLLWVLILGLSCSGVISQAGQENLGQYSNVIFKRFTTDEGLSQNLISAIAQDSLGFIWIGTKDGLNRFDGYSFRSFQFNPSNQWSLADNYVTCLHVDHFGRLWVGTFEGGLHLFDSQSERFIRFIHDPKDSSGISHNHIQNIVSEPEGNVWVGTNGGGLNLLEIPGIGITEPSQVKITHMGPEAGFPEEDFRINSLFIDSYGLLWIGTTRNIFTLKISNPFSEFSQVMFQGRHSGSGAEDYADGGRSFLEDRYGNLWAGNDSGLYTLDRDMMVFIPYNPEKKGFSASSLILMVSFLNQGKEEFWISTEKGLSVLDPATGHYTDLPFSVEALPGTLQGRIISLFADMAGAMWIGSNGHGLSLLDPMSMKFNYPTDGYFSSRGSRFTVRNLSIRSFYLSDSNEQYLWIGANEGFFRVDRENSVLQQIDLPGHTGRAEIPVFSVSGDNNGLIWLATGHGLVRYDPVSGSFKIFPTGLQEEGQGHEPRCSFVYVKDDQIWILTPNTLARLNAENGSFEHFRYNNDPLDEYKEAVFPAMLSDSRGNFWIGAKNGLHYFDAEKNELTTYSNDPHNLESLNQNHVLCLLPDPISPEKYLWVGTAGAGLSRFDMDKQSFKNYNTRHGLPNNTVYGMLADEENKIWISTNRGLSKFNTQMETFSNYSVSDGLQSNEFNAGAYYKSPDGEMFFGGIRGYNCFFPTRIKNKDFNPPVIFTGFKLLSSKDSIIQGTIGIAPIKLKHNQNDFSIEFASMDIYSSLSNVFEYSLSTRGENWISLGTNRTVTFTDLKPGNYILKVKGTNNDGIWSNRVAVLRISIEPPWWGHPIAYSIYFIAIFLLIVLIRKIEITRLRMRNQMKIAQIETARLKELDQLKSEFFTNISHELRTPLTLIKGPIEQMLEEHHPSARKKMLTIMHSNASRLSRLINQLLDLSKLESGEYLLKLSKGKAIIHLLEVIVCSFDSLAVQNNVSLKFKCMLDDNEQELLENCYYDQDVIEKIINNLLFNALKFTPEGGMVKVFIFLLQENGNEGQLGICIEDTGIGIPLDKMPFIYDRFFQVDASPGRKHEGTGIGLAYVKELARVHAIDLFAESQEGIGTKFFLRIPLGKSHFQPEQIKEINKPGSLQFTPGNQKHPASIPGSNPAKPADCPVLLIVENNEELRYYLGDSLSSEYNIKLATGAEQGLKMAINLIPDLIISDVMMPGIDGFQFCEKLKTNEKTCHIPVVLLTARAGEKDKMMGLENGADDYLTKPFNPKELKTRVKNLIENRRLLQAKFSNSSHISPGEIMVTSRDRAFMEKLMKIVEDNISIENFSVEDLAVAISMSKSQLHRKLKAIINQPANHFIRSVRMQRAMKLLQADAGNIADISYMVGYSDPGYFSKTFKKFFGVLPSEIKSKNQDHQNP